MTKSQIQILSSRTLYEAADLLAAILDVSHFYSWLFADFSDPADDPDSPDYRITAEHFPRYLLPTKVNEAIATVPVGTAGDDSREGIKSASTYAERVPQPQPLQRDKEEVAIRAEDFADLQFIGK